MNHHRARNLIDLVIDKLELDLRGLTVLTEVGTNAFIYTPFIAAAAGAKKVYAVAKESRHGTFEQVVDPARDLAVKWGLHRISFVRSVTDRHLRRADIITNLNFVRPIDKKMISRMRQGTVIPYMRFGWEYREYDVDLEACREYNIPVLGTNEDYLGTFDYCGPLAVKMMLDRGLEVLGTTVAIFADDDLDHFKTVIEKYLIACGATMGRLDGSPDAIIIISNHDAEFLQNACISIPFMVNGYMESGGLAQVGIKPVIDLHATGLKVGELMYFCVEQNDDIDAATVERKLENHPLCEKVIW